MRYLRPASAAACVLATALIPAGFPAGGGATGFDRAVAGWVHRTFPDEGVDRLLLLPSNLLILVPLLLIGAFFARRRSGRAAWALVAGPVLAVALTELLLKPLFGRHLHSPYNHRTFLDYPSGSTVALVATVTAFALVALSWRARAAIVAAGVLCLAAVGVGLVWFDYHQPTDVVGGTTFGIAVPLALGSRQQVGPGGLVED